MQKPFFLNMLRVKLNKLRQVCATTVFIPTIFRGTKPVKKKLDKYFNDHLSKATKSTDSNKESEDKEKRRRIIEKCFAEKTPVLEEFGEVDKSDPLKRNKINLYEGATEDKNKSFLSKILQRDKSNDITSDQIATNTQIKNVAAKVEEIKIAYDNGANAQIHTTKVEDVIENEGDLHKLAQNLVQIDKTPQLHFEGANVEEHGTPKVSALLQNINVQTTTGDAEHDKKLGHNLVNVDDKLHHLESSANEREHILKSMENREDSANEKQEKLDQAYNLKLTEALDTANALATGAKLENEKLVQHVVQIDRTPNVNINISQEEPLSNISHIAEGKQEIDLKPTTAEAEKENIFRHVSDQIPSPEPSSEKVGQDISPKISEALQNAEVQAATPQIKEEKLSPHIVQIDKTPVIELKSAKGALEKSSFLATTAKIEDEKLTQKIDNIDETPHVEAGVDKIEGFNTSPKILGHDNSPNLTLAGTSPEPSSDQPEQVNLDELAKKCLGKLDGDIDQILLKELKNIARANAMKFNFPKDDESSQKYFSQIFENKGKDNNNIVFDVSNAHLKHVLQKEFKDVTEIKFDKFDPFRLDTVPMVPTDTRDYKDDFKKSDYTPDGIKNILLDIPAVLDPYDMQAIPFYQYVSKENIVLQELQIDDTPVQERIEVISESDIKAPMNEHVILKHEESKTQESNNEIKEFEGASSPHCETPTTDTNKPTETDDIPKTAENINLSESDISKLLEYKNVLSAQGETFGRMSNITQAGFTTDGTNTEAAKQSSVPEEYTLENKGDIVYTSPTPTDDYGNPIQSNTLETPSGSFQGQQDRPNAGETGGTAISANQEPGEYFPTSHLSHFRETSIQEVDYIVVDAGVTYTGVFDTKMYSPDSNYDSANDSLLSQSISYYSTFPQLSEFEEYSTARETKKAFNRKFNVKEVVQPYQKEAICEEKAHNPPKAIYTEPFTEIKPRKLKQKQAVLDADISYLDERMPLSVLLRRVRERNRIELVRAIKAEIEIAQKKPNCIPPLDRSKPKTTLNPKPCQPKPKEDSCGKPPACKPPEKKDPCAKYAPFFLGALIRSNTNLSIPSISIYEKLYMYISLAKEITFKKLMQFNLFRFFNQRNAEEAEIDNIVCARDFEPWVPIPSWPIPEEQKKKSMVCPKEGCKLPVKSVRSNTDKPCLDMPKKISPSKTHINLVAIDGI